MSDLANPHDNHKTCVCGYGDCPPCRNPTFCAVCRQADADRARLVEDLHALPHGWTGMSFERLWEALHHPERYSTPVATLRAAEYLYFSGDPDRMKSWLERHTPKDRSAILTHLEAMVKRRHAR